MTFDATPKSTTANSNLTVEDADAYFSNGRPYATTWSAAGTVTKQQVLVWATSLLDQTMEWAGAVRDLDQALRWPRSGCLDADGRNLDYDTVPALVKNATAELALFLLTRDRLAEPDLLGNGLSEVSVGPITIKADSKALIQYLPDHVVMMLAPVGVLKDEAIRGARAVRLRRT